MARLAISLMGPYEVVLDGQPVAWFQSDKVRALLAYLAVEADTPHTRHALAGLFWPDVSEAHALHSLSQALCNLRSVLHDHAPPRILVSPHTIQFNPQCEHWVDVEEFGKLVNWGSGRLVKWAGAAPTDLPIYPPLRRTNLSALQHAVALYRGPFLEDLALGDGVGFEEWAAIQRERLHRLVMEALYRLAALHEASGELEEALACIRRQVELDPWREEAHAQAMRLLALSGRRSEALVQYGICRRLLAAELGVEPAAETTRLYEQIRDGSGDGAGENR